MTRLVSTADRAPRCVRSSHVALRRWMPSSNPTQRTCG